MAERTSSSRRIELQNVAEREVMRYAGDHAMWHKYVHNVELDATQILKMKEMDQYPNTIDFSSRRTGKTAGKELYDVEYSATNADQEIGIVAPREAQSITNLNYHLDAIRRSPILTNYVAYKSGRAQISDTKYEFMNRSKAQAYGIMAQVDGGDLTVASLEEVDDMPKDRLYSRFLLMLGSTRRLGASAESKNDPQIRITGVFKGADTLTGLLDSGEYHVVGALHGARARGAIKKMIAGGWLDPDAIELENYKYPLPLLNAVNAIQLGLLNESFIKSIRADLSTDEFTRQLLCINTASRNLIWEKYLRRSLQIGLESGLQLVSPMPGETYKKRGLVSFGYDHSGHGENPESSKYAFVVLELIGIYVVPIFARTWAPGTDEKVVEADLYEYWRYFRPDEAMGDAYGIGLLTSLNDRLYKNGLTNIDRLTINDGESTASTWSDWAFSPLRFEGMVKHSMAQSVRATFHNGHAAIPYYEDHDYKDLEVADLLLLCKQLINIKPLPSKTTYSTYAMAEKKIGDDLFDAYMAAHWGLTTRGAVLPDTVIETFTRTREQLLGQTPIRLPSDPVNQLVHQYEQFIENTATLFQAWSGRLAA